MRDAASLQVHDCNLSRLASPCLLLSSADALPVGAALYLLHERRVVQQEAKECVSDERCVSLALQLWLALLAGATAAEAGGPEAPAGFRQVLVEQLLEWADMRRDVVNDAEVGCSGACRSAPHGRILACIHGRMIANAKVLPLVTSGSFPRPPQPRSC